MKLSLRYKTAILFAVMMTVLSGTLILITSRFIVRIVDEQFEQRATSVANTVAATLPKDPVKKLVDEYKAVYAKDDTIIFSDEWGSENFNNYLTRFAHISETEEYKQILEYLRSIQDVNEVDCIYLMMVIPEKKAGVYVVDAAYEDACDPGVADPIYEVNKAVLTDPTIGFPAYITDTPEYGWLVTSGTPVYSESGNVMCYAMTDIPMNEVRARERGFLGSIIALMIFLTLLVAIISIYLADRTMIVPLQILTKASKDYQKEKKLESHIFENMNIQTGDELEELANSMEQMEAALNTQVRNLTRISDELYITQNLAVKDPLTGIRNKLGFNREEERLEREIRDREARFGLAMIDLNFLKRINDQYGHAKGDLALKKISALICHVFAHSPVFRFGGDEFVVVLENNDLDKIDNLIEEFYQETKKLAEDDSIPPWEKVSASIGYAIYDPQKDKSVDDVFRRADKAMYRKKTAMKAVREDEATGMTPVI
jgi:diguanylate cyclase (GGDEF)-like protein